MSQAKANQSAIKEVVKEALAETLYDQRALLREVFAEVLEDFALTEAIQEGRKTSVVSRDAVFRTLRSKG